MFNKYGTSKISVGLMRYNKQIFKTIILHKVIGKRQGRHVLYLIV